MRLEIGTNLAHRNEPCFSPAAQLLRRFPISRRQAMTISRMVFGAALACAAASVQALPVVLSAAGANAAAIQGTVDAFRLSLGPLNANVAGSFGSGRREINWDGVPNNFAAPNNLPGNFFNANSPRGVELSTPGSGLQVSANAGVAPVEFGNIDANYPDLFVPFSAQRLFTALGSSITDVRFFIPGSASAALTNGFGVVFSDVDLPSITGIEFFDLADQSLGQFFAPSISGNETLSFLGVRFSEGSVVARARITSGNQVLAQGNTATDLVVMDDFIYGEPVLPRVVPEPSTGLLLLLAMAAAVNVRRSRRSIS
ncbi:MAG: PEP-CTERM sorting domain-containing protein [Candidatus Accumulibacter sp.]|nr:PEP-CTERM sorting domain-containing protein [Accumulibacter sp.]